MNFESATSFRNPNDIFPRDQHKSTLENRITMEYMEHAFWHKSLIL